MALTSEQYQAQLLDLLPPGAIWPRDLDTDLADLLLAKADELARVDGRADQLIEEADPRTTSELLSDWERVAGLPDQCMDLASTPEERRQRLHQKLVWQGGQSAAFFIELLEALGYPGCTITEFRPFRANSKCNASLNQGGWRYAWRINVPGSVTIRTMTATSPCNVPIRRWGDSSLACILARYRPAHTVLYISYGAAA
ncbi:YmfQ family protein [Herbaspirillum rubrisubalbicans]|uniref:YmfQ family protein n=1 Tax=Herbaspirillum rubrisubalbicans TaxID=80842 RepID=UPI001558D7A3|nr:putative phage tail protein [Herbaspirillum rubrisubalbicans]NQE47975.1 hypothetical protein [Herbaspirillum rubrisubalbicans]